MAGDGGSGGQGGTGGSGGNGANLTGRTVSLTLGGTIDAGPQEHGFQVLARLPVGSIA